MPNPENEHFVVVEPIKEQMLGEILRLLLLLHREVLAIGICRARPGGARQ